MISVQRWLISVRVVPQHLLRISQIQNKSHNDILEPSQHAFLLRQLFALSRDSSLGELKSFAVQTFQAGRVNADPAAVPRLDKVGGVSDIEYYRLHAFPFCPAVSTTL